METLSSDAVVLEMNPKHTKGHLNLLLRRMKEISKGNEMNHSQLRDKVFIHVRDKMKKKSVHVESQEDVHHVREDNCIKM